MVVHAAVPVEVTSERMVHHHRLPLLSLRNWYPQPAVKARRRTDSIESTNWTNPTTRSECVIQRHRLFRHFHHRLLSPSLNWLSSTLPFRHSLRPVRRARRRLRRLWLVARPTDRSGNCSEHETNRQTTRQSNTVIAKGVHWMLATGCVTKHTGEERSFVLRETMREQPVAAAAAGAAVCVRAAVLRLFVAAF